RPNSGIYASIGGQRGVFEPDINGFIDFKDMSLRPSVDLIEVYAQGYMKTWMSSAGMSETIPEILPLFTQGQLQQIMRSVNETANPNNAYIVGNLNTANYKNSVQFKIY